MNMELIVLGINYFIILLVIFLIYRVADKIANSYKEKNKRELDLIQMSMSTSLEEMTQTIDSFINEAIQEFTVMNNIQDSKYINSELEQEMRLAVMESVSGRISINLLNKLRLFYKEDIIPDLIAKKIFLAITAYTAINNAGATNKKNK
nr:MAG TPA: hypothetical protein [Caudoviricetes sp.]